MFNKFYGVVSVLFLLMMVSQTFVVQYFKNPILIKVFDYGFWFTFGAFSALFILRRVVKNSDTIS